MHSKNSSVIQPLNLEEINEESILKSAKKKLKF